MDKEEFYGYKQGPCNALAGVAVPKTDERPTITQSVITAVSGLKELNALSSDILEKLYGARPMQSTDEIKGENIEAALVYINNEITSIRNTLVEIHMNL